MKLLFAVCLLVEDVKKSEGFYTEILQLQVNSRDTGYVDFKLGDMLLGLFQKTDATAMFPKKFMNSGGGCVLAYQVKNVKQECDRVKKKGVEIFEGPKKMPWGQEVAYFKDPDDTIWEITS